MGKSNCQGAKNFRFLFSFAFLCAFAVIAFVLAFLGALGALAV
jgi:hypothetical protein